MQLKSEYFTMRLNEDFYSRAEEEVREILALFIGKEGDSLPYMEACMFESGRSPLDDWELHLEDEVLEYFVKARATDVLRIYFLETIKKYESLPDSVNGAENEAAYNKYKAEKITIARKMASDFGVGIDK